MSPRNFFTQLAIVSISTFGLLFLMHLSEHFKPFQILTYGSLVGFILLSIGMYYLSSRAANSTDKNLFLQQVMLTTFMKMVLTIAVIIGYHKLAEPESKAYALPFLLIYVIFTIFETSFMMKLSKVKPDHAEK